MSTNRFKTSLYYYIAATLKNPGINIRILLKIQEVLQSIITECCIPTRFPNTKNKILQQFYLFLGTFELPNDQRKIQEVLNLVDKYVACCPIPVEEEPEEPQDPEEQEPQG